MAILRTRMTLAQIRAENNQAIKDADGKKLLAVKVAGTPESYLELAQGGAGEGPSVQAKSDTVNTVDLALMPSGDAAVTIMGDSGRHGILKVVNSAFNGFQLKPNTGGSGVFDMVLPSSLPSGDAFLKIDSAGAMSFSTGSASSFTISDGSVTETVNNGDTITFSGTSNEVEVSVSATDSVTIGLPNVVVLTTSLQAPTLKTDAIQDASGVAAINISGNDVTILGDLTVSGTTVTLNVENLTVEDKLIDIASSAPSSGDANGAGIRVTDSAYASLLFDNNNTSWDANINFNLETATLSYKINDVTVVDSDGARFTDAGVGVGITQTGGLATLDVKVFEGDIATNGSNVNLGPSSQYQAKSISVGTTAFTPDSFFQVFLNGILQRGSDDPNAPRKVDNGTIDYSYSQSTGAVRFKRDQVVDLDLVTIYYTV